MELPLDDIQKARVMVVGCGALGNEVLKNLALMGVGHVCLVDFDTVEQTNLTRSILFRASDIGKRKVDAAREALERIHPKIQVQTIFGDIAYDVGLGLIRKMDVLIGCVDSRWARYCIQRLCLRAGKTWVDGGILNDEGTLRVFAPGKSCYACSLGPEGLSDLKKRMSCAGVIRRMEEAHHAPTSPLSASVIGALQAQEAVKISAHRPPTDKMVYFEGAHMDFKVMRFEAWDEDCALHERWSPVLERKGAVLRELLEMGDIVLNDPFVDYLVNKSTQERHHVRMPARKVSAYMENDPCLGASPRSLYYQKEYEIIDREFPYPDMRLEELGIPPMDILKIKTPQGYRYVEI